MKTKLLVLFFFLLQITISSQNLSGRFSSSVYSFERYDNNITISTDTTTAPPSTNSYNYLRTFQTLQLNAKYGKFAIKTRLNYERDIAKEMLYDPRLRIYNLYFEGRNLFNNLLTFKLGRISLFNNVSSGTYDGGNIKLKYAGYKLDLFYGANVPAYQKFEITDDWANNYVFSGRLDITALKNHRIGISYIDKNYSLSSYKTIRLDENLNPIDYLIENNSNQFKYVSADVSYRSKKSFNIYTRYDYDLNFNTTSRIELTGRYEEIENWGFSLYYNYRAPQIRYNSIFAVFDYGNTHEVEAGADYKINTDYTVTGKFANVTYKDDNSQRATIGLNTKFGSVSYRKTFGYAGELDALSIYTARTFLDGFVTPSVGLGYTSYKLSANAETNNIVSLLAGVNVRPYNVLSFDLQAQYFNNKIYRNDFRILFKLNYWFNVNL
ncbi:MAG: hypothetical protein L3J41_04375 [Melioribacteraceae bacterium]|nr:hypothetical protein [Melioribacteraceae bacterium]